MIMYVIGMYRMTIRNELTSKKSERHLTCNLTSGGHKKYHIYDDNGEHSDDDCSDDLIE